MRRRTLSVRRHLPAGAQLPDPDPYQRIKPVQRQADLSDPVEQVVSMPDVLQFMKKHVIGGLLPDLLQFFLPHEHGGAQSKHC